MRTIVVTGSSGLVGSETVRRFAVEGARVIGIDNDMRAEFFGRRSIGGSRHSNCSMLEVIEMCEAISGKKLNWTYEEGHRIGDHIWWISDVSRFQSHCPNWTFRHGMPHILQESHHATTSKQ